MVEHASQRATSPGNGHAPREQIGAERYGQVPVARIRGLLKEIQRRLIGVGLADIIARHGIGLKQILNRAEPNLTHDRQPTRVGVP